MGESSLFILHKDTALRLFLIKLTTQKVRFVPANNDNAVRKISDEEVFDDYGDEAGGLNDSAMTEHQTK